MRAALSFVLLFTALAAVLIFSAHQSQPSVGGNSPANVILVSRGMPQNVGLYADVLAGLKMADSQEQLETLVNESTTAIVIDRSIAGDLSPSFLALQLARGVYIFGLNLSEQDLKTVADWNRAHEIAYGRPSSASLEDWGDSPPYQTFFTYTWIGSKGHGGGLGRLDILGGLFKARLARTAGLSCRERADWSKCKPDPLLALGSSSQR
jgi:hypothetical protein